MWLCKAKLNFSKFHRWNYDDDDWKCRRLDEKNLILQFLKKSEEVPGFESKVGKFVSNREELLAIDTSSVDYLLGMYSEPGRGKKERKKERKEEERNLVHSPAV